MIVSTGSADGRQTDALRTVLALHAIALDGMAEGLCVLDAELRVVLFNRKLVEILDLPRDSVKLGASLRALLGCGQGAAAGGQGGEMWRDLADMLARRDCFDLERRAANGSLVRLHFRPVSGGGWVSTCAPASRHAADRDKERQIESWRDFFVNSSRGVCMYDADKRLVLCNDRYLRLYGLDRELVRPGMSFADVLQLAVDAGMQPYVAPGTLDEMQSLMFGSEPTAHQVGLSDGRTVQLTVRPAGREGWIVECEDVTAHLR